MNTTNNESISTTPVNALSSPPAHSMPGEQARRCLFSPGARAAMLPYARCLSFSDTSDLAQSPPVMSSTPASGRSGEGQGDGTITITSSPWRPWSTSLSLSQIGNVLPSNEQHVLCGMHSPGEGYFAPLSTPTRLLPQYQPGEQNVANFPPEVEEFVNENFQPEYNEMGSMQQQPPPIFSYFPPEVEAFLAANPTQVYSVVVRTVQYFDFFPM
jgi:hypothetical protein